MKETGVVTTYFEDRGFGYVTRKGKKDVFFHITNGKGVKPGRNPKKGDRFIFEVVEVVKKGEKKLMASPWCFDEDWEQVAKQEKAVSLPDSATKPLIEKVEAEADGNIAEKPTVVFRKPNEVKGARKYHEENGAHKDHHRSKGNAKNWKKEAGLV